MQLNKLFVNVQYSYEIISCVFDVCVFDMTFSDWVIY